MLEITDYHDGLLRLQETAPRRPADGEREAGGQERGATGYFVYARGTPKAGENSHCGVIDTCIVAKSERAGVLLQAPKGRAVITVKEPTDNVQKKPAGNDFCHLYAKS
jgi:hypothetical protein